MLVVASASLAAAVMPTAVPLVAFSSTALAVALVSLPRRHVELVDVVDGDREACAWCVVVSLLVAGP